MLKVTLTSDTASKAGVRVDLVACDAPEAGRLSGLTVPTQHGKVITVAQAVRSGRVRVIGSLGKAGEIDAERIRRVAGQAARWLRDTFGGSGVGLRVLSRGSLDTVQAATAAAEGFILGSYRFDRHRSSDAGPRVRRVEMIVPRVTTRLRAAIRRTGRVCASVVVARDLAHEPPNVINPATLATRARRIARDAGLACRVYDQARLKQMRMGAMLAVGRASSTPARLIELSYRPSGSVRRKPVVLVGKAVTFDTGGYSLKPRDGMVGMKYDKCGGTTVLAAMHAVAACKPRVPVVGLIAAAENMISGNAYRPDDIITTRSGKTVQIVSADAEGRMVLCDALTYAAQAHRPAAIIDLATLTGGVLVALGRCAAGVFSNNDALREALIASGGRVHERLWPLPVWDDYFDLIKGDDSDLKNSAGREAHAVCGAIFLKQFVDQTIPWAHLDIAGVADVDSDQPYCPKGATGFGVRLLVDYLMGLR